MLRADRRLWTDKMELYFRPGRVSSGGDYRMAQLDRVHVRIRARVTFFNPRRLPPDR